MSGLISAAVKRLAQASGAGRIGIDQSQNYVTGTFGWFCTDEAINVRQPLLGISTGAKGDFDIATLAGTDDTANIQAALTYATSINKALYLPPVATGKAYQTTQKLLAANGARMFGDHSHMGFRGGTVVYFRPATALDFFGPTGLPATGKDGYFVAHLFIVGNSTSAAGNSDTALDIRHIIKSNFWNIRIQGFRTAIRCEGTIGNVFDRMHPTDNFVQNVLYAGAISTTDEWRGGYNANAPTLIRTTGETSSIKFIAVTFESAGAHSALPTDQTIAFDFAKETEGWELLGCYGEDLNSTDNATNVTFRMGLNGTAPPGAIQIAIQGGKWGGRNAGGNRGSFMQTHEIDGVYIGGGAQISRYTTVVDNSAAATLANQVVFGVFFCASVSTIVTNPEKAVGLWPTGSLSDPSKRGQQMSNVVGDQLAGTSTACTGAITTPAAWKLTKDGIVVTLTLPNVTGVATAAPSFVFGEVIPAKYRPSTDHTFGLFILNNGVDVAQQGMVHISYLTGAITVYRDATRVTNFTAAAMAGMGQGASTTVTWTV
jgi:hypothetical protein